MEFIGQEETTDYSLQAIAIKGAEQDLFYMSASSVRTILHDEGLVTDSYRFKQRRGGRNKPNRPDELDGPNQCGRYGSIVITAGFCSTSSVG